MENLILGIIQGVFEWLPVSSEGILVLLESNFFGGDVSLQRLVSKAIFFHLGTLFAALIFFWKELKEIFKDQKQLIFFTVVTFISLGVGFVLFSLLGAVSGIATGGRVITILTGFLLLITGFLQIKGKGAVRAGALTVKDGVLLGLVQGLAILPGFSRSGLTVSLLLFLGIKKTKALKISFIAGIPIVFFGNIFLGAKNSFWQPDYLVGISAAFVFGLITIKLLLEAVEKINFGVFVICFGVITIIAGLI